MPTLDIEGRKIEVDDSFLKLSPEEQSKTVDHIASSFAPQPSAAGLAGRVAIQGATGAALGLPALAMDAVGGPINLMYAGQNYLTRKANEAFGTSIPEARYLPSQLESAANIGSNLATMAGAPQPQTENQKLAVNVGTGALSAAGPGITGRLASGIKNLPQMMQDLRLGLTSTPLALDVASGATGEAARSAAESADIGPVGQFGASLLGGALPYGVGAAASAAKAPVVNTIGGIIPSKEISTQRAANYVAGEMAARGENPNVAGQNLQSPTALGTVADRSGSTVLSDMQETLMRDNPDYSARVASERQKAVEGLTTRTEPLREGNPADLRPAALAERERINAGLEQSKADLEHKTQSVISTINDYAANAENQAKAAAAKFEVNDSTARTSANVAGRDILDKAYTDARALEKEVYKTVDLSIPVKTDNLISKFSEIKSQMSKEQTLPSIVEAMIRRFKGEPEPKLDTSNMTPLERAQYVRDRAAQEAKGPEPVTLKDVQNLRSEMLDIGRTAGANGDRSLAGRMNTLAGAALDDMATIDDPRLAAARKVSRTINDKFTRSYAGDVLQLSSEGGARVEPSMTFEGIAARGQKPNVQLQQLEQAVTPVTGPTRATADLSPEMRAAQENFLRLNAEKLIDLNTGMISPSKASSFLRDNAETMTRFPALKADIENAIATQQGAAGAKVIAGQDIKGLTELAKAETNSINLVQKTVNEQAAFNKILKAGEKPETAISKAISGNNPVRDLTDMARLANKGGPDAVAGMRAAALTDVFARATSEGSLSAIKLEKLLSEPLIAKGPSLIQQLRQTGIITAAQHVAINKIVEAGKQLETAIERGAARAKLGPEVASEGLMALLGRAIGAGYMRKVSVIGHLLGPLQGASEGAKLGQRLFAKLPTERVQTILAKALEDETLMKDLLRRAGTDKEAGQNYIRLINGLLKAGLITAQDVNGQ